MTDLIFDYVRVHAYSEISEPQGRYYEIHLFAVFDHDQNCLFAWVDAKPDARP